LKCDVYVIACCLQSQHEYRIFASFPTPLPSINIPTASYCLKVLIIFNSISFLKILGSP